MGKIKVKYSHAVIARSEIARFAGKQSHRWDRHLKLSQNGFWRDSWRRGAARRALVSGGSRTAPTRPASFHGRISGFETISSCRSFVTPDSDPGSSLSLVSRDWWDIPRNAGLLRSSDLAMAGSARIHFPAQNRILTAREKKDL